MISEMVIFLHKLFPTSHIYVRENNLPHRIKSQVWKLFLHVHLVNGMVFSNILQNFNCVIYF